MTPGIFRGAPRCGTMSCMKPATLEPGLLRVIQILMLLQILGLPLVRRQVGAGMGVEVPLLPWLFVTVPVPLFLVLYAWHPWWRRTLGRAFLPLLLVIAATNMLVDKYLTLAWVVPPQQEIEALLLVVRLWFLLHMITLLVAWQYSLAWATATALLLSFGDAVLTLPFVAASSPFYPLLFLLFLARAGTVTWVAVMVGVVGRAAAGAAPGRRGVEPAARPLRGHRRAVGGEPGAQPPGAGAA